MSGSGLKTSRTRRESSSSTLHTEHSLCAAQTCFAKSSSADSFRSVQLFSRSGGLLTYTISGDLKLAAGFRK